MAGSAVATKKPSAPSSTAKKPAAKKKTRWTRRIILLLIFVLIVLSPFLAVHFITEAQKPLIYTAVAQVPNRPVAIIFGAGLNRDGSPSWMLADRVQAGVDLYKQGKVKQLLMTGDGVKNTETTAMTKYATERGVPASAILQDKEGLRTYDSCYRAVNTFKISEAVLVTQGYHLPRALFTCNGLGINSVGLKAGQDDYPNQEYYNSREFLAVLGGWLDVNITKPKPDGK